MGHSIKYNGPLQNLGLSAVWKYKHKRNLIPNFGRIGMDGILKILP